jgi:hypothetical protein
MHICLVNLEEEKIYQSKMFHAKGKWAAREASSLTSHPV